jgi:hypothetical protein
MVQGCICSFLLRIITLSSHRQLCVWFSSSGTNFTSHQRSFALSTMSCHGKCHSVRVSILKPFLYVIKYLMMKHNTSDMNRGVPLSIHLGTTGGTFGPVAIQVYLPLLWPSQTEGLSKHSWKHFTMLQIRT